MNNRWGVKRCFGRQGAFGLGSVSLSFQRASAANAVPAPLPAVVPPRFTLSRLALALILSVRVNPEALDSVSGLAEE